MNLNKGEGFVNSDFVLFQLHGIDTTLLKQAYESNPALGRAPFSAQLGVLSNLIENAGVNISSALNNLGIPTFLSVANCQEAQLQWAYENDKVLSFPDYWEIEIMLEQINRLKPRFLLITAPDKFDSKIVRMLTWKPEGIMGWLTKPASDVDWTLFDVMLVSNAHLGDLALSKGAKNYRIFLPALNIQAGAFLKEVPQLNYDHDVGVFLDTQYSYQSSEEILSQLVTTTSMLNRSLKIYATIPSKAPFCVRKLAAPLPDDFKGEELLRQRTKITVHLEPDWTQHSSGTVALFKAALSGSTVMVPNYENIADFFTPHTELETFESPQDLAAKLQTLLKDVDRSLTIAKNCFTRVSEEHNSQVRAQELARKLQLLPEAPPKELNLLDLMEEALRDGGIKLSSFTPYLQELAIIEALAIGQVISLAKEGDQNLALAKLAEFRANHFDHLPLPADFIPERYTEFELLLQAASAHFEKREYSLCQRAVAQSRLISEQPNLELDLLWVKCMLQIGTPESLWNARCAALETQRLHPNCVEASNLAEELCARVRATRSPYLSFEPEFDQLYALVAPFSMLPELTLYSVYGRTKLILERGVEGCFVDLGAGAGGTALLIALTIKRYAKEARRLYVFDTFTGLPELTSEDSILGADPLELGWSAGTCKASAEQLIEMFRDNDVLDLICIKEGLIEESFPEIVEEIPSIAMANIDLGLYSSTSAALDMVTPYLHRDASVAVHQGLGWLGVEKAITSRLEQSGYRLKRIAEECGIFWLGPKFGFAWTDSRLGSAKEYM